MFEITFYQTHEVSLCLINPHQIRNANTMNEYGVDIPHIILQYTLHKSCKYFKFLSPQFSSTDIRCNQFLLINILCNFLYICALFVISVGITVGKCCFPHSISVAHQHIFGKICSFKDSNY